LGADAQGRRAVDGRRQDACNAVEEEEDEHLYHTMGWTRELWIDSLGLPAVLRRRERRLVRHEECVQPHEVSMVNAATMMTSDGLMQPGSSPAI
jgi:hypothetical protein